MIFTPGQTSRICATILSNSVPLLDIRANRASMARPLSRISGRPANVSILQPAEGCDPAAVTRRTRIRQVGRQEFPRRFAATRRPGSKLLCFSGSACYLLSLNRNREMTTSEKPRSGVARPVVLPTDDGKVVLLPPRPDLFYVVPVHGLVASNFGRDVDCRLGFESGRIGQRPAAELMFSLLTR